MSNIVLIEPYRILQQAIALSLAQEHKVQVRESITGAELQALKECDLLVIDAASLAEMKLLTPELVRMMQGSETPMLWLEDEKSLDRPKREKFQVLKKPLEQKVFKEAVGNLLAPPKRSEHEAQDQKPNTGTKGSSRNEEQKEISKDSEQPSFNFIDLVDVVGETPSGAARKTAKKSQ